MSVSSLVRGSLLLLSCFQRETGLLSTSLLVESYYILLETILMRVPRGFQGAESKNHEENPCSGCYPQSN